jgi:hypothetical protein
MGANSRHPTTTYRNADPFKGKPLVILDVSAKGAAEATVLDDKEAASRSHQDDNRKRRLCQKDKQKRSHT